MLVYLELRESEDIVPIGLCPLIEFRAPTERGLDAAQMSNGVTMRKYW